MSYKSSRVAGRLILASAGMGGWGFWRRKVKAAA
jgi:hypothetical protein